jgi:hypothetical protein
MSQLIICSILSRDMQSDGSMRYEIYTALRYVCSVLYPLFQLLLYRVFQEESATLAENNPSVKL